MTGTPDKGKFSTGIGQDVIEEALRAVEKRSDHAGDDAAANVVDAAQAAAAAEELGASVDLMPESEPPPEEAAAPPEAAPAAEDPALKKELEELRVQLEFSQAKGRELMEKI